MNHSQDKIRYFAHERLAAYELALQALRFICSRRQKLRGLPGSLGAQFERALVGVHTNLCSGAAARGAEAKRHFRISLSEAGEAGGCSDAVLILGALSQSEYDQLRAILLRLCACLYGLAY